jgi:hypothetical protein
MAKKQRNIKNISPQSNQARSDVAHGLAQTSVSNSQQKPTNLVAIDTSWKFGDEGCQYCDSFAKPVNCSMCDIEGCEDCILTIDGKRVCVLCADQLKQSELREQILALASDSRNGFIYDPGSDSLRLAPAKVLMFPVGVTPRHAVRPEGGPA